MSDLSTFIIFKMSLFSILFNVTANVTSIFSKVKTLNRLYGFFYGALCTFHYVYEINQAFILVFNFKKLCS